jgi:sporulation protein YlmC with PRC-barrel domain
MKVKQLLIFTGLALMAASPASYSQVAGSTKLGIEGVTLEAIAIGWSAKRDVLGKTVYNEEGKKVGIITDVIIAPDNAISYLIIGAGGFVGIKRHNVAIPANQVTADLDKIVLPGATKEAIKAMPKFEYAKKDKKLNAPAPR